MDFYWQTGGKEVINCFNSSLTDLRRPIWNPSVFHMMRVIYVDTVGSKKSSINIKGVNASIAAHAIQVPYEIQYIPKKGRGIVATDFISKHQLIWNAKDNAKFYKESKFEKFLERIGYDLACDVLMWSYVETCSFADNEKATQNNETDDNDICYRVGVELVDASYMNTAGKGEEDNVAWCGAGEKGKHLKETINCSTNNDSIYASRDIQPGEEIMAEYSLFSFDDKIKWFDELYDDAWWELDEEEEDDEEEETEEEKEEEKEDCRLTSTTCVIPEM